MLDSSTKRLVLGTPIKEKYHRRGQPTVKADLFSERGAMDVHGSSTSTLVTWVPRLPTRHFRIIHYTFQLVLPGSSMPRFSHQMPPERSLLTVTNHSLVWLWIYTADFWGNQSWHLWDSLPFPLLLHPQQGLPSCWSRKKISNNADVDASS